MVNEGVTDRPSAFLSTVASRLGDRAADRIGLRSIVSALVRERLEESAKAGDRAAFYKLLTPRSRDRLEPAELAGLLGVLGDSCRSAKNWRAAADAYHHALQLQPEVKGWKDLYLRARQLAPEWGFYSHDSERAWDITRYPAAPTSGLVAPVRQLVVGWIPANATDTQVHFKLNGTVIADSRAVTQITLPDGHDYLQFSRYLKDLWSYAGGGDALTIESGGRQLEIIGRGTAFKFRRKSSRARELISMMENGFVFNKYGRVKASVLLDREWQRDNIDLYARLREDLAEIDVDLFPFYGTMLGAVREHDFIGHDNDFDTVYISAHREPEEVRREFKDVCGFLLSRGYDLYVKKTHTWVKIPGTPHKLDIFFAWFDTEGCFDASYGYHGEPLRQSPQFAEFRIERLGEFEIPVPTNAEAILEQLYGRGWRTPDPGFAHGANTRKLDRRYHLTTSDVTELHWNQFYRDHEPDRASRFAQFTAGWFESTGSLVEFGCGSGRDGIFFATKGWVTLGCDRSPEAIARATEVLASSGGLPATFETVDVASADEIRSLLTSHADRLEAGDPLVVYVRFFLHAIDEDAQGVLLDTLTSTISGEFYLAAEFRTLADRDLAKAHGQHYRRYIDHNALAAHLAERYRFTVLHLEAGQGLSPYDGEDPHLARIIARRGER